MNKYKFLLLFLFFCLSFLLCCNGQTHKSDVPIDTVKFKAVGNLVFEGQLSRDTLKLRKALNLTDSLLKLGYTGHSASYLYHHRTTAYFSLGDIDKGLENMEKYVSYYPENSTLRMSYRIVKAIAFHDEGEEKRALKINLAICDSVLAKSYQFDYAYYKVQLLYYLYGKEKASEYLRLVKKRHPSPFFPSSREEWIKFCKELDIEWKHVSEMSTTRNGFFDSVY